MAVRGSESRGRRFVWHCESVQRHGGGVNRIGGGGTTQDTSSLFRCIPPVTPLQGATLPFSDSHLPGGREKVFIAEPYLGKLLDGDGLPLHRIRRQAVAHATIVPVSIQR
jgi:hypothetical protein